MTETLQEFVDSRGVAMRVDRQAGVIRGAKILGLHSRNGRMYLPEALREAVSLYEDAKVNVNHPKGHAGVPRDYQDRIGAIRGVEFRPGEGLFADFHFNPKHALAEQLLWDAEHAPENVGFSHNVEARTARHGDRLVVEAITRVQSVDLVADPATTRGLFECRLPDEPSRAAELSPDAQAVLVGLTVADLQAHRPDLLEAVLEQQAAQVQQLQAELERLTALEAAHRKQQEIGSLLREYQLPEPDATDWRSRLILSERFLAALLATENPQAMRELVEERARLVRTLAAQPARGPCELRPTCREQQSVEGLARLDVKEFVAAIT